MVDSPRRVGWVETRRIMTMSAVWMGCLFVLHYEKHKTYKIVHPLILPVRLLSLNQWYSTLPYRSTSHAAARVLICFIPIRQRNEYLLPT